MFNNADMSGGWRVQLSACVPLTVGEVSLFRLSPRESRFTLLLLVTLLWGMKGPCCCCCCSSPAAHADLSAELRPFQRSALWEDGREEKGQPRFSSASSGPPPPPSPLGLSSPQSEPTELLNDSEEILRDEEDIVVLNRRRRRRVVVMMVMMMMGMMTAAVVRRRRMAMLQRAPYHVHLCAGEASDRAGGGGVRPVRARKLRPNPAALISGCEEPLLVDSAMQRGALTARKPLCKGGQEGGEGAGPPKISPPFTRK